MIDKIFTVYDEKAAAHLPPFFMHRTEQAIRTFADCINSSDDNRHQFSVHPSDYTLFEHGEFDNEMATFDLHSKKMLGNGVEFIDQKPDMGQINENKHEPPVRLDTAS